MIDERHPLYHLALVQLGLPGFLPVPVSEPLDSASNGDAAVVVLDPVPAKRRPAQDKRII